jgi:hypothetical protein
MKRQRKEREPEPVNLSTNIIRRIPFIIFEDYRQDKIKEFINALPDDNTVLVLDDNDTWTIEKAFMKEYNGQKIGMFTKNFKSMMSGGFLVSGIRTKWYAVHLRHFEVKDIFNKGALVDLTQSYIDVESNGGTFLPDKDEDMKTYVNRVITVILKNEEERPKCNCNCKCHCHR